MDLRRALHDALAGLLQPVYADLAPLQAIGVDLAPVVERVPQVAMRREEVDITIGPGVAVVQATFWLENEGPALVMDVGFPAFGPVFWDAKAGAALMDFQIRVDGAEVAHSEARLDNRTFPMWRSWRQHFPARRTTRVEVHYWVPLCGYRGLSRLPFTYVLRTGRFWKGVIGEAIVRVRAMDIPFEAIREAFPLGYTLDTSSRQLTWHFRDLFPEVDIGLLISPSVIEGWHLGLVIDDIVELNESSPPRGTRVMVSGLLDTFYSRLDSPMESELEGERRYDKNTAVPAGIQIFSDIDERFPEPIHHLPGYNPELPFIDPRACVRLRGLPLVVPKAARAVRVDPLGYSHCLFIGGRVEYEHGRLVLDVEERLDVELIPPRSFGDSPEVRAGFPALSKRPFDVRLVTPSPQDHWRQALAADPGQAAPMIRARVPHPRKW